MNKRPVTNELICASFNMIRWSMTCDKINLEQKTFVVLQKAANYHILCVSLTLLCFTFILGQGQIDSGRAVNKKSKVHGIAFRLW